jgi:hypothetical protein
MSVSNSWGQSKSKNQSQTVSQDYGTIQDPNQQYAMSRMWGTGDWMSQAGAGQEYGYQGYNQGQQYLGQAMGGLGNASDLNNQAMMQLGSPYMRQVQNTLSNMQNPGVDPMMSVYARQLGQNFNEQIMPGMRGDAAVSGQLGSSRAGIGQGLAAARAAQQLQDFGAQLYGQNQDRALNAANFAGALQGNISNAYGQGSQQAQNIAAMYGQGSQQAQALGQFGMGIPWFALQQQQGLLGNAIMRDMGGFSIGDSSGKSSSWNQSGSFGF